MAKNIHMIFLRKEESMLPVFRDCEQRIRKMHPSWNITLWDEDSALLFLEEHLPECVRAYQSFRHNVQRADFLRLALVYVLGGFYMDMDMLPLRPLDDLADCSLVLAEEMTISEATQEELHLKYRVRIANYMFGGKAEHPFLRSVMNAMASRASVKVSSQQEVLDITGPGLLTDTYWDNLAAYSDITLLHNSGQSVVLPDGRRESCLFGNYAVHLHAGTWRNEIKSPRHAQNT